MGDALVAPIGASLVIKSNTCPYCGGPYTVNRTCYGTDTPGENACPELAHAAELIADAVEVSEWISERVEIEGF